jgi:hypothetical protein
MHEDHGMMQTVAAVPRAAATNYRPRTRVAAAAMSPAEVSAIYPEPSRQLMYLQSLTFQDGNPELGQDFPGFRWTCRRWSSDPPELEQHVRTMPTHAALNARIGATNAPDRNVRSDRITCAPTHAAVVRT